MSTELAKEVPPAVIDGAVRFTALLQGRVHHVFEVSGDALVEHFGAQSRSDDDLLAAFKRGKAEILDVAAQSANIPVNGMVELGTGDFSERRPGPASA
ncbi:DUF1488 domain-containing protein [Verticiella sediminum]|uniref:DUF1488 domain-containing protein n=1 Tax=Verticiella sediminum TaxID=1247510 RepID=A0A556ACA3_9BURK|nr:DUF1488 family protein [Verticiella sediminum]TSH90519.1 DUF1488 domain-containing protein [Verticiella sediminum]